MALMSRNQVTFIHVKEKVNGHEYINKTVKATYFNSKTTTNVNGSLAPQNDITIYFNDVNFVEKGTCKGKLTKNQWTIAEGDYVNIGNDTDVTNAKKVIQVVDYRNIPSKLNHVEVIAR